MSDVQHQHIVTRFAPSPTGALHVGGARTALFAWAYARQQGASPGGGDGRFLLRIEDTDRARSSDAAAQSLMNDLRWLGINWDGEPVYQSERHAQGVYDTYVQQLLDAGRAYEDDGAVRFRMDRDVAFDDEVYGHIEVQKEQLEDFVIRKGDAGDRFPTFHLAVVIDDHDFGVTHVIRGQEHLTNTTKHVAMQDALGFDRPTYVHTPSIMNPDGSKMSKRDKAKAARKAAVDAQLDVNDLQPAGISADRVQAFIEKNNDDDDIADTIAHHLNVVLPEIDVRDFRASGYLPGTLINYLSLLGWNPGDNVERFGRDFLVAHFSFKRLGKSNSRFDRDKLFRFNADDIAAMPPDNFAKTLHDHLTERHGDFADGLDDAQFAMFAKAYQPRARTLSEPVTLAAYLLVDDDAIAYDQKAVKKVLHKADGEGLRVLHEFADTLAAVDDWSSDTLEQTVKTFAESRELGLGKVAQPLRVALTGSAVSPSIGDTLSLVGRQRSMHRIELCLERNAIRA
ncbi:MAG: glutamate--tRNA ligase family protein [Phycisphaeraceae bacterium]|jgi:glutamyl-tRNA synthetase|nr:glutamate--tRNA ligase family protein [Phycisphaeraceae bacterium]